LFNSTKLLKYVGALGLCRGSAVVEFVGWRITGLTIKAQNDGATSGGLKLQCVAVTAFSTLLTSINQCIQQQRTKRPLICVVNML